MLSSSSLHVSEAPSTHLPHGGHPACVMLVTADGSRRSLLRACIDRQAPGCRIEVVDSCFDAMARAGRMPSHLMVLDLSLNHVLIPALQQFLTRSAPHVALHVFDDRNDRVSSPGVCAPSVIRLQARLRDFIDERLACQSSNV